MKVYSFGNNSTDEQMIVDVDNIDFINRFGSTITITSKSENCRSYVCDSIDDVIREMESLINVVRGIE